MKLILLLDIVVKLRLELIVDSGLSIKFNLSFIGFSRHNFRQLLLM